MGSPRHAAAPVRPDPGTSRRLAVVLPVTLVVVPGLVLAAVLLQRPVGAAPAPAVAAAPLPAAAPAPAEPVAPSVPAAAVAEDAAVDAAIRAAVVEQQRVQRLRDAAARRAARWNRRHAGPSAGEHPRTVNAGPRAGAVWVVGDSIAAGIGAAWPGNPVVVAVPGAHSSSVVPRAVPALGTAAGRPLTVVALGTNDDPTRPEAFRAEVRALLAAAPGCTVWTTIHQPDGRWEALNAVLRQESARSGGRLQLADWDALALSQPGLLQSDGIHPRTGTVYSSIVALAQQAASRCR